VFPHSPVGPVEFVFMLAAVALVAYSAYFIKTHSRRQIVIAWIAGAVVIVIALVVLKLLQ
jgi:hypothetical protein